MAAVPVEVLVCVSGFPVYKDCEGIVGSQGNKGVWVSYETIILWIFYSKLDVWVNKVDILEELVTMSSLLDAKGVIHIPKP